MLQVTTEYTTIRESTGFAKTRDIPAINCKIAPLVFGSVTIMGIRDMGWRDCDNHAIAHALTALAVCEIFNEVASALSATTPRMVETIKTIQHITSPTERHIEITADDSDDTDNAPEFEKIKEIKTQTVISADARLTAGRHELLITMDNTVVGHNVASTRHASIIKAALIEIVTDIRQLLEEYANSLFRTLTANSTAVAEIAKHQQLPQRCATLPGI
ncbi:hypothetical protein [Paremcibacter congregatus]|uniref:hypothetical protein n=1 Tax=Paremcibacter congregatus TaxID=2043170 RepID=UPI003A938C04